MYSLLCVFISQYSNKVDFISMGEAHMGGRQSEAIPKIVGQPLLSPLGAVTASHTTRTDLSFSCLPPSLNAFTQYVNLKSTFIIRLLVAYYAAFSRSFALIGLHWTREIKMTE